MTGDTRSPGQQPSQHPIKKSTRLYLLGGKAGRYRFYLSKTQRFVAEKEAYEPSP